MPFVACKLPNGLSLTLEGKPIVLVGANIGEDLENVSRNGSPNDNRSRVSGYGLTELSDEETKAFEDWKNKVTFNNGAPADGKLAGGFPALENGSILGPFKNRAEAEREAVTLAGMVTSGLEGLDPEKEGTEKIKIEADKDAGKQK